MASKLHWYTFGRLYSTVAELCVQESRTFTSQFSRISADFEVTDPLPNVTETLPRSFAGSISTNRAGHANDTLFFWGFEKEEGSLTVASDERIDEPWLVWLNGGPGASRYVRQSIYVNFAFLTMSFSFLGFFAEVDPFGKL
jgi:hypothetical protein